ncbi:MAG: CDP-alcohol phosphatidyltransferase family protein [Patescibacteria group bacterium]
MLSAHASSKLKENMTWANLISLLRPFLVVFCLYFFKDQPYILAASIVILLLMDALDGFVARKFNQASKLGAHIDILCDRILEIVILFVYAKWGLISYFFPIVFMIRGILTDSLRYLNEIYKDEKYKHPLSLGKADNRFFRGFTNTTKILAFSILPISPEIGLYFLVLALAVNLYRGIPVIFCKRSKQLMRIVWNKIKN